MFKSLILFIFLITLGAHSSSFAIDVEEVETPKKYLVIEPFESSIVSDFEMNQVNKIELQVATKQTIYHLLIGTEDTIEGTRSQVISMGLTVKKVGNIYNLEAHLFDMKKQAKIKVKKDDGVDRPHLQRRIYLLLESLFEDDEIKKKQMK